MGLELNENERGRIDPNDAKRDNLVRNMRHFRAAGMKGRQQPQYL